MFYYVKQSHRAPAVTRPIPVDESLPKVCVIGAGSSGLTAAKNLHMAGVPFDCFEMGSKIGGNWVYDNPNGVSACYETLQINTSCPRMAFSDFPMPKEYPPYASHYQVANYFEKYADHFGFRDKITFNTEVKDVSTIGDGRWNVTIEGPGGTETREYDAVMVANGHHWDPRWPDPAYPGQDDFSGEQMHAHSYLSGDQLEGKDVLVVGAGNSAMDIAVEAAKRSKSVGISIRRGQWVLRKFLFGVPADQIGLPGWMPWWATAARLRLAATLSGGLKKYGLPKPPHAPGQSHPVQSEDFRKKLGDGSIKVFGAIERFEGDTVHFTDGSRTRADLVVWATGYKVKFPFLDESIVNPANNDLPLWKRTFTPDIPGLYFIGLLQPVGAVMPLAEAQAEWVTEMLTGRYTKPSDAEIRTRMKTEHEAYKERFYDSPRHTMEVDFDNFLWDLKQERKAGAKRRAA